MLEHLFSPIKIGTMELRNRIVLPPMTVGYGVVDGILTERHRDYYEARAAGGAGLIITEAAGVHAERKYGLFPLGLYDDAQIESWSELAKAVHKHGAKVAAQLMDPGPESMQILTGKQPVGPSAVVGRSHFRSLPRELSIDEIEAKYKLSQNRPAEDQQGVVDQLDQQGAGELARAMRKALF